MEALPKGSLSCRMEEIQGGGCAGTLGRRALCLLVAPSIGSRGRHRWVGRTERDGQRHKKPRTRPRKSQSFSLPQYNSKHMPGTRLNT